MTEEAAAAEADTRQEVEAENSEQVVEERAPRTVPLEAHEAERRKRQEKELEVQWYKQKLQEYERSAQPQQPSEFEGDEYAQQLVSKLETKFEQRLKAEREATFKAAHPDLDYRIQTELEPLLQKKPWLAQSIAMAPNRYARALEILEDYAPRAMPNRQEAEKRIAENKSRPGSPDGQPKSTGNLSMMDAMKSMSRKEFSQWRAKIRGTTPNIR